MTEVVKAYRTVLSAARLAFKNDPMALQAARTRAAQEFRKPLINSKKFDKEIKKAYQVANILTHNLVQAVPKEDDRGLVYEIKIDPKRHELGDNESRFGQKSKTTDPCGCTTCVEPY